MNYIEDYQRFIIHTKNKIQGSENDFLYKLQFPNNKKKNYNKCAMVWISFPKISLYLNNSLHFQLVEEQELGGFVFNIYPFIYRPSNINRIVVSVENIEDFESNLETIIMNTLDNSLTTNQTNEYQVKIGKLLTFGENNEDPFTDGKIRIYGRGRNNNPNLNFRILQPNNFELALCLGLARTLEEYEMNIFFQSFEVVLKDYENDLNPQETYQLVEFPYPVNFNYKDDLYLYSSLQSNEIDMVQDIKNYSFLNHISLQNTPYGNIKYEHYEIQNTKVNFTISGDNNYSFKLIDSYGNPASWVIND